MRSEPVRVASDLETTGLRSDQDAIIEIGAVKFAGAQILDTFQSFVNPSASLPYRIHRLTGITNGDLRHAPPLAALSTRLRGFIGSAPLVGHSVAFDAAFLRRAGLAQRNPLLDTYELASLLLPNLPSYTLAAVAEALRVPSSIHHRALADADLSRAVFLALLDELARLDTATIEELAALPASPDWTPTYLIRAQVREREEAVKSSPFARLLAAAPAQSVSPGMSPALLSMAVALDASPPASPAREASSARSTEAAQPARPNQGGPGASLRAFMREGGALLLELERTEAALTEALVAVAQAAQAGDAEPARRVVIAAHDGAEVTRIAQTLLPRAFALAGLDPTQVGVAELDEHDAYLCLHRWFGVARESQQPMFSTDLTRGLAKLTVWARETRSGRRADVALSGGEGDAWARVRSGVEFADTSAECPYRSGGYCFVTRAAQHAGEAGIVVTTHAALAAQLIGRDSLLPESPRVIILDAREMEDELRRQQTFTLDAASALALLDALSLPGNGAAPTSGLLALAASLGAQPQHAEAWSSAAQRAHVGAFAVFRGLRSVLQESQERHARGGNGRRSGAAPTDFGSLDVDMEVRASNSWEALLRVWADWREALTALADAARQASQALASQDDDAASLSLAPRARGAQADLLALARRIDEIIERGTETLAGLHTANTVYWLRAPQPAPFQQGEPPRERRASQREAPPPVASESLAGAEPLLPAEEIAVESVEGATERTQRAHDLLIAEAPTLYAAPVQVGAALAPLWAEGRGVAALGWALSVGGDFEYTRSALGFPESARAIVAQPDYSQQTLLCLPTDAPEPAAQSYHGQFESLIVSLARALEGDVVVLFPSHAALRTAALGVRRALERYDILALAQGIDGSARQLWQSFYGQPRTVLLGAGAFWDGAEQRNRPPACVVVARTPFPPQSDPLVAARAEVWADQQAQYMTPQAALKLRQALGGLAWSHNRRNAVVLFDRRLQTRGYGATIIGSLPQCELYSAPTADLAERIADWTRE